MNINSNKQHIYKCIIARPGVIALIFMEMVSVVQVLFEVADTGRPEMFGRVVKHGQRYCDRRGDRLSLSRQLDVLRYGVFFSRYVSFYSSNCEPEYVYIYFFMEGETFFHRQGERDIELCSKIKVRSQPSISIETLVRYEFQESFQPTPNTQNGRNHLFLFCKFRFFLN